MLQAPVLSGTQPFAAKVPRRSFHRQINNRLPNLSPLRHDPGPNRAVGFFNPAFKALWTNDQIELFHMSEWTQQTGRGLMFFGPLGSSRRRRLASVFITSVAIFGFAGQALAACYTPREASAERAIRIHSELMVVGLTCAMHFDDPGLFVRYAKFTNQHRADIVAHEQAMIGYFAKTAEGNPKRRFDHWRTSIANAVSTRAALSSASIYCGSKGDMMTALEAAERFHGQAVQTIIATAPVADVTSRPMCTQDAVALGTAE
ncbi:MAG: hypothetical protein AAF556_06605 [Pseudomonadota bacterium]